MQAACRRPSIGERAGSAGGPKPGRVGFCVELGGGSGRKLSETLVNQEIGSSRVVEYDDYEPRARREASTRQDRETKHITRQANLLSLPNV
jgi:hypothetical protein